MKLLRRNLQRFSFQPYIGKVEIMTDDGQHTGEYEIQYGDPIECVGNIGAYTGGATTRQFGLSVDYDAVIIVEDKNLEINELDLVTVGKFSYRVKRISPTLNHLSIALSRVETNA